MATICVAVAAACTDFNDAVVTNPADGGPPFDTGTTDSTVNGDTRVPTDSGPPTDSTPPPPDTGSNALQYLNIDDAARVCALAFNCPNLALDLVESIDVPIDGDNFSLCMDWATGPIPPDREGFTLQQGVLQCTAQAPDCKTAAACSVFEELNTGDPRCPPPVPTDSGTYCTNDGGTKVDCVNGFVQNCFVGQFTPGSSCRFDQGGTAWCSLPLDSGCPAFSTCQSSFQDYCGIDNLHFRINCLTVGGLCSFDDAGNSQCGPFCNATSTACAGTSVGVCDGIELTTFDCPALDASCSNMGNAIHCAQTTDQCSPTDSTVNKCTDSTHIDLCIGGQKVNYDCSKVMKTCVAGMAPQTDHCG